ncbi:MAG TPA: bifunctional serine/threonine-protein kinase/formylglycine-generating enzyme family protein [Pyrinomonadaceae bacterium]|nr:bifunctional serine/threonine-protein kinase/formylglycine-generating enzyme family protein [Pyrinomonadaceae bacterium]
MKECQVCKNCFADDVATCPNDGMPTVHTIAGEPVLEGKYQIERRLGQGGMGVVYKARHAYLKTQLAIKVILPDLVGNDPQLVTRFRQEALAAAAIRHTNVVNVTDYGVIEGTLPFLVMEYVEGESLHDLLAREGALAPERALELMSAVCAGVGAAHHQGIVHRDLKPLNIMICSDKPNLSQAVKILDFGLAKIKSGELLGSFIQAQTTGLMGSPYYMAPEQWADEEPDVRADIYSLGVMFYQMLTGDVPFKGSSIPAIMKKHISDPAPSLADGGLKVSPAFELAMAHSFRKNPDERTPSVEAFVEELTQAIHPGGFMQTASGMATVPVSSLTVKSRPPRARVFVDNVAVGETHDSGDLLLEGIQSGNHQLRVSHSGFQDWLGDVVCDGKPVEVIAELTSEGQSTVIVDSHAAGQKTVISLTPAMSNTQDAMAQTVQDWSRIDVPVDEREQKKKQGKSGLLLGIGGVLAVLILGGAALAAAYLLGYIGGPKSGANNATPTPTPAGTPVAFTADLAAIPGGTFKLGRDDGRPNEQPANTVTVQPFRMDKTEVTNAEYYQFIKDTGYKPVPAHWVNDRPIASEEKMPVRFVNIDDISAFAAWRSKRDGSSYRLPTEAEWEFAARNGSKGNLYPWGDNFDPKCAVVDRDKTDPEAVGSATCPDDWGIVDLIGNVYEWTGSKAALYPGSKGTMKEYKEPRYMIRGGAAFTKSSGDFGVNSAFRADVAGSTRDKELGFRLVTQ